MPDPLVRVQVIVKAEAVQARLNAMAPKILAQNRLLAEALLKEVKGVVYANTPVGPGHFGYHGRDTLRVDVSSKRVKTTGKLMAAVQLGWRERGTKRGERARWTAKRALAVVKRYVSFYYGGMGKFWRS